MDKKGLMYRGQFASRDEKEYAVELYRDGYSGDVGDLSFRSESPLLIEWPETDKEEPLQGSTATLGLLSPGDMTYADLYTTKACSVVMDVYREGGALVERDARCGAVRGALYRRSGLRGGADILGLRSAGAVEVER